MDIPMDRQMNRQTERLTNGQIYRQRDLQTVVWTEPTDTWTQTYMHICNGQTDKWTDSRVMNGHTDCEGVCNGQTDKRMNE